MPVEYFIHGDPQHAHEEQTLVLLAQQMQRAFGLSEQFYALVARPYVWKTQLDVLVLAPHAITLLELKSCTDPVYGREHNAWRVANSEQLRGGSAENPYQQIVAARQRLIKYLDRNRQRFLMGNQARAMKGLWGQISAALVFSPHLHPDSDIVLPPTSRAWLGVIGLNEVADFLFTRTSSNFDLRPQELRRLAIEALHCHPWNDVLPLLNTSINNGHLWLLDTAGQRAYAFPVLDNTTLGRSRENMLVIPMKFSRTSRSHARLRVLGSEIWVQDNNSTHGTYINGTRVSTPEGRTLRPGDTVALGDPDHPGTCRLRYERHANITSSTEATSDTAL
ncbi:MAG: FHA domain-containing protein [Anaerolineae bacterium]|nr:FHA domain-containing protein [Anaerolineae bacterium]